MIQLILVAILVILLAVGGLAVTLFHFWGWKGMVAFPFLLIVLVWLTKVVIGQLIKRFALRLFSMKSGALRGATMTLHSITPVAEPVEEEMDEDEDEETEDEPVEDEEENEDEEEDKEDEEDEKEGEDEDEEKEPRQYYEVEMTITPGEKGQGRVWEPGEFMLASEKIKNLGDLEEKEVGTAEAVQIWNGSAFGPDDEGKYPGEQRLKVTFAVKPGTTKAWLQYYNETLGILDLPPWKVAAAT
jgi:hypothetical protein